MLMGGMHKNFHPQKMINGSRKRCNQIISHKYQQAIYREILNFSSEQNVRYTLSLIYNLGIINVIIMYTKYYKTKDLKFHIKSPDDNARITCKDMYMKCIYEIKTIILM